MGFTNLPAELHIGLARMQTLNAEEIGNIRLCCRCLCDVYTPELFAEYTVMLKRFPLQPEGLGNVRKQLIQGQRLLSMITKLRVSDFYLRTMDWSGGRCRVINHLLFTFKKLLGLCERLKVVEFEVYSPRDIYSLLSFCQLKRMAAIQVQFSADCTIPKKFVKCSSFIRVRHLSNSDEVPGPMDGSFIKQLLSEMDITPAVTILQSKIKGLKENNSWSIGALRNAFQNTKRLDLIIEDITFSDQIVLDLEGSSTHLKKLVLTFSNTNLPVVLNIATLEHLLLQNYERDEGKFGGVLPSLTHLASYKATFTKLVAPRLEMFTIGLCYDMEQHLELAAAALGHIEGASTATISMHANRERMGHHKESWLLTSQALAQFLVAVDRANKERIRIVSLSELFVYPSQVLDSTITKRIISRFGDVVNKQNIEAVKWFELATETQGSRTEPIDISAEHGEGAEVIFEENQDRQRNVMVIRIPMASLRQL